MAIVRLYQDIPDYRIETPPGLAVTSGALGEDIPPPAPRPSFLESAGAIFEEGNLVGSAIASDAAKATHVPDPAYAGSWEQIKGTDKEKFWDRYVNVNNQAWHDAVTKDIDQELENTRIIQNTPAYLRIPLGLLAGIADPSIAIPGGAIVKTARGGMAVAKSARNVAAMSALAVGLQEAGLQSTQQLRPFSESVVNIAGATLLGGLIGAGGSRLLGRGGFVKAGEAIDKEVKNFTPDHTPPPAPIGAAIGAERVSPPDLEALTIKGRLAGKVAKATRFVASGLRLSQSPSAAVRTRAFELVEMTHHVAGEDVGIAAEQSVETLVKEHQAGLMRAVEEGRQAFSEYRKRVGYWEASRSDFDQAVGRAMVRGDVSNEIPEVTRVAQTWRREVFDPEKNTAIELGRFPEDIAVDESVSYFSRVWKRQQIVAQEGRFKGVISDWLSENGPRWIARLERDAAGKINAIERAGLESREATDAISTIRQEFEAIKMEMEDGTWAREVADVVYNKITGRDGGEIPIYGGLVVDARGPFKNRTLHIPDEYVSAANGAIEDYMERDINLVGRRYSRIMSVDNELTRKFGSPTLKEQIAEIRADYARLRNEAAKDKNGKELEKALAKLDKSEKSDVHDIESLRDILRGTYDRSNWETNFSRIARVANMLNYIRSMGQVIIASIPEAYRTAMVHGLGDTFGAVSKIGTKGFKMAVHDSKAMGNIVDRVLAHRLATLAEITNFYSPVSPAEHFLGNMVEVASSWNGIRLWTDSAKMISSVIIQNKLLRAIEKWATGAKVPDREMKLMLYLGIKEPMAKRIYAKFQQHGESADNIYVGNVEKWVDEAGSQQAKRADLATRRAFAAAINKDMDTVVINRSIADIPLFANTPQGRLLFQFNTFNLSSHQRYLIKGLQEGSARFISSLIAMTSLGMLSVYLRGLAGNQRQPSFTDNPGWWIGEGLDYSGVLMVPMQMANAFEILTGFNPVKAPLRAFDNTGTRSSRIYNRNLASLLGPSVGLAEDIGTVVGTPFWMAAGNEVTQGQKNAAERLLPYNSYPVMRQMMRYYVNPREQ